LVLLYEVYYDARSHEGQIEHSVLFFLYLVDTYFTTWVTVWKICIRKIVFWIQ